MAVFLVWMAATHPVVALALVLLLLGLSIDVVVKLFRFLQRLFRQTVRREPAPTSLSPSAPA